LADLLQGVRRTIKQHALLAHGDRVVVGVSGGPDSLCLLHLLVRFRDEYDLQLYVAHLHHGARGAEADGDAQFVADIAAQRKLPATVERRDVPQIADEGGLAFEEAARRVRYSFLAQVASDVGAARIAVGHNADDQAETVLMHLLRGSGLAGLRGMLPSTPLTDYRLIGELPEITAASLQLIRPLLYVPRREIELYCSEHGLSPRFDRSNLDQTFFRNRLRHELLPTLEQYNPGIRQRLCHTAQVLAAEYEILAQLRRQAWGEVVRAESDSSITLDRAAWRNLPVALQRATLRHAAYRLRRSLRDVNFVHVENARAVALEGETGAQATLPQAVSLMVGYETLTVADQGVSGPPPDEPLLWSRQAMPVEIPGTTPIPDSDWVLEAESLATWDADAIAAAGRWQAYVDEDRLPSPAVLRTRQRGDRFRPLGMGGHTVRLSELMINLKVPAAWRDHVPLLAAGSQIVWVCGHRLSHDFAVTPRTRRAVKLYFERVP
jgi:tRNA(Ile)-lysidine synthase